MARRAEATIILGPILYFRGEQGDRWWLSALFVLKGEAEPDDLRVDGVTLPVPPRHLSSWRHHHVWRFDFAVPRGTKDTEVAYGFPDGESWSIIVPGRRSLPRLAYVTGNAGGDSAPDTPLWRDLLARHHADRFHLLLHGGNQFTADRLWTASPLLGEWHKLPDKARARQTFTPAMAEEATAFFFDAYVAAWGQPEVAAVLARIPSVMMWDETDIPSGCDAGAADAALSQIARGVLMAARRQFALFQIGAVTESLPECVWGATRATVSQGFRLGEVGLLALDLRSERTPRRTLSDRSWLLLPDWLERFADARHLVIMTNPPLLFPPQGGLERIAGAAAARIAPQDRDRLLQLLVVFSRRTGCRITLVSGHVHVAARGILRGGGVELWQLVAPDMTHPPPHTLAATALEWKAGRMERLFDGYSFTMPPFGESGKRIARQRGWLSLVFDGKGQLHARWSTEGQPNRYGQVI